MTTKRFITPFAESGIKAPIADVPSSTDVNYLTGYTPEYALDPLTNPNARFVEITNENQILNDITGNIKHWQENTFPEFITPASNGGVAFEYKKGDVVLYDGVAYESLDDSNEDLPTASSWVVHKPNEVLRAILIAQGYSGNYGFFENGFTYNLAGDIGIDTNGGMWTYADAGALPVTIAAGTVPSEGVYNRVIPSRTERTLSEAISENAPIGFKYTIDGGAFDVVSGSDTGGFYRATLANGNKLKYVIGMMQAPEHFGAVGDPNNITDETTAMQAFFQFYKFGVLTAGKVYGVSDTLNLTSNSELHGTGEIRQLSTSGNVILGNGVSNTKILGGKIKGNITTQISGYSSNCVFFQLSENIKVSGLICETTEFTTGVKLANTTDFLVEDVYVYGDGSFDVSVLGTSAFDGVAIIDGSRDGVVTKCRVKDSGIGVSIQSIATNAPIYNVTISYCNIQNMSAYGIMSYRLGSLIQDIDIVHNYVKNIYGSFFNTATNSYTHGAGIYLQTVDKHRVNFNDVYNTCINTDSETLSPAGISCAYTNFAGDFGVECEFIGNYVDGSEKYGMLIDGIDHTVIDNKIMNTVRGHLYSRGSENLKISKLTTKSTGAYTGILLATSNPIGAHKNITIEDVTLKDPATGISADGIEGGRFDKVKVLASTAATYFNGITTTSNTVGLIVDDATIEANGGWGIRLQGSGNRAVNSSITGASTGQGLAVSQGAGNWLENNQVDNFAGNVNPSQGMSVPATSEITLPWYAKNIKLKVNTSGAVDSIADFPVGSVLTMYLPANVTVSHLGGSSGYQFFFPDGLDRVSTRDGVLTFEVYFDNRLTCTGESL